MSNKKTLFLLVVVIIISLVTLTLKAPSAEAAITGDVTRCIRDGVIRGGVEYLVGLGIAALSGEVPVIDNQAFTKERILDLTARCAAREILDRTVGGMLDVIRKGGRDGGEAYVKNWRNFQTNAQYRGENVFRTILANTKLCEHIQQDVRDVFGVTDKFKQILRGQNIRSGDLDPFTLKARCSLPDDFDIEKYNQDFAANGGWDRLIQLARPENNFYGSLLQSYEELEKQRAIEVAADLNDAKEGFSSLRSCVSRGINGRCLVYGDILTPSTYLKETVGATIQQELAWITNVDELQELVINGVTQRLISRLNNLGASEEEPTFGTDPTPPPITIPGVPAGGTGELTAVCSGGSTPTITLLWAPRVGQNSNSLQRSVGGGGLAFIFQDPGPPFTTFAFADRNVSIGQTYTYRVKYTPATTSNEVTITPTAAICVATPPDIPPPPPGGGGSTGSCAQEIPSGTPGPFNGDVGAAQQQIKAENPSIVSVGDQILDINGYFSRMEQILEGRGYVVTRDGDQEINIYRVGASSSEQYAIRRSDGQLRNAWKGTGCPLP